MGQALKTLKRWFETIDANLLADNIQWEISQGYPVSKQIYVTKEEVFNDFFPELTSHFSKWNAQPETFIESENKVTVVGYYFGNLKSTDEPIKVNFIHIWTVRDGKIAHVISVADTAEFLKHDLT